MDYIVFIETAKNLPECHYCKLKRNHSPIKAELLILNIKGEQIESRKSICRLHFNNLWATATGLMALWNDLHDKGICLVVKQNNKEIKWEEIKQNKLLSRYIQPLLDEDVYIRKFAQHLTIMKKDIEYDSTFRNILTTKFQKAK
jgi:hypothetical protein